MAMIEQFIYKIQYEQKHQRRNIYIIDAAEILQQTLPTNYIWTITPLRENCIVSCLYNCTQKEPPKYHQEKQKQEGSLLK